MQDVGVHSAQVHSHNSCRDRLFRGKSEWWVTPHHGEETFSDVDVNMQFMKLLRAKRPNSGSHLCTSDLQSLGVTNLTFAKRSINKSNHKHSIVVFLSDGKIRQVTQKVVSRTSSSCLNSAGTYQKIEDVQGQIMFFFYFFYHPLVQLWSRERL